MSGSGSFISFQIYSPVWKSPEYEKCEVLYFFCEPTCSRQTAGINVGQFSLKELENKSDNLKQATSPCQYSWKSILKFV